MHGRSERGAILVYVAIAIVVLMGFSAFVLDYGVFWLARRQAQNAADAGALAGVIAQVYDEPDAPGPITLESASQVVTANQIFGAPSVFDIATADGTCPPFVLPSGDTCVRVAVYRDAAHGNPLPTYLSGLFGVTTSGVQATATAQLRPANTADCLKPLMLPDLGGRYSVPPSKSDTPGYTLASLGSEVLLNPTVTGRSSPGFFVEFDAGQGNLRDALAEPCPSSYEPHIIYEIVQTFAGHEPGPASLLGLQDIVDLDPQAYWDSSVKAIRGSCAPACGPHSPRIITIGLFNPTRFPGESVYIRDFMSVFVDRVDASDAHVYITPSMGRISTGGMPLADAGFLKVAAVVR